MRAVWIVTVIAIAACANGCKKKPREQPKPTAETVTQTSTPKPEPLPPLKPLPPATDGPVYALIQYVGVIRLDSDGWKLIGKPTDSGGLELGTDGTLWVWNSDRIWKLEGDTFTKIPSRGQISDVAAAADGTLWIIADGELRHLGFGAWTTEVVPGGDPPRGVEADAEGVWVHTLDRTYLRAGTTWQPFDVPGVTGQHTDILTLASTGRDAYLATTDAVMTFEKAAWRLVRKHVTKGEWAWIAPGPAGRFALTTRTEKFLGDATIGGRGLTPLDVSPTGITADYVILFAVDDRGRTWATAHQQVVVFDAEGKMIKRWGADDSPLLRGGIGGIAVGDGGPAGLEPGERTAGKVTGKVEGSAAGMTVRACTQSQVAYNKEPCEGVGNARSATTIEGGKFTLDGVTVGPMFFWVKRGDRWRETIGVQCCAQLTPDSTVDVGTLRLR
ncbi:MAG: hypothetical protein H0T46_32900 [Deltaproteobacteria bacterium]|nr:hypothetical protein [Deltaproteobacteria bacterium]